MKTYLSKAFFTLFFLSFITINANDILLRKLIRKSEFAMFMKEHAIDQKKLTKSQNKVIQFTDYNLILHEYILRDDQRLFIVKNDLNGKIQYYYGERKENYKEKEENTWVIVNNKNENIENMETDLNCVKDTVAYMKKACSENITCSITCDLSANCTLYMYIVAYAHCAAGGEAPKASVISNSIN